MDAREAPPGGLDRGRVRPDARHRGRHADRVSPRPECTGRRRIGSTLDRLPCRCRPLGPWDSSRRAGVAAADRRRAARPGLPFRARLSGPGRLPAPVPADDRHRPTSACRSRRRRSASEGIDLPAWFIPARGGRAGAGRRARPRLGVGARPDAPDRALPPRRRVPLPDDRCPRPRREPGRGPAGQRRRVRARRAWPRSSARRPPGGDGRRRGRALDGGDRRDPRGRRRPARRRGRRDLVAGRSVPADAPDVPAGPPADPRPDRLSAGLADDPRLPPAARPRRRRDQRDRWRSPATAGRSCSPTATRTRSCRSPTWPGSPAAARRARRGRIRRPTPVETLVVPGGQHSWLYEDAGLSGGCRRFLAAALGGPLDPDEAAAHRRGHAGAAHPGRRGARCRAVDTMPGGFRTLAQVALPGATRMSRRSRRWRPRRRAGAGLMRRGDRSASGTPSRPTASIRRFADRPLERRAPRAHPPRRPPRQQLQEPAALGIHRLPRPDASAGAGGGRAVRRPPGRGGRRRRARHAGSARGRTRRCR